MNRRLTHFAGARVVGEDGAPLGHLLDFRATGTGTGSQSSRLFSIDAIVCGELGFLERAGLRASRERTIPWSDVIRIERGRVVVRKRNSG